MKQDRKYKVLFKIKKERNILKLEKLYRRGRRNEGVERLGTKEIGCN